MSKIHILSTETEGFRSIIKPFPFNWDRPGLNLIKGVNGAGKTTTIEALVWALYGINLKDTVTAKIPTWQEDRPANFRGTRVICDFELVDTQQQIKIARHIDFKGETEGIKGGDSLMVFIDGVLQGAERDKDESQFLINQLLGIDAKTFMNSVMFGQRMAKLIEQDNGDKRKLFEQLFDMAWVEMTKKKADLKISELTTEVTSVNNEITKNNDKIVSLNESITQEATLLAGFEVGRKTRLTSTEEELATEVEARRLIKEDLVIFDNNLTALGYDAQRHTSLIQQQTKLNNDIASETKEVDRLVKEKATKDIELSGVVKSIEDLRAVEIVTKDPTALQQQEKQLIEAKTCISKQISDLGKLDFDKEKEWSNAYDNLLSRITACNFKVNNAEAALKAHTDNPPQPLGNVCPVLNIACKDLENNNVTAQAKIKDIFDTKTFSLTEAVNWAKIDLKALQAESTKMFDTQVYPFELYHKLSGDISGKDTELQVIGLQIKEMVTYNETAESKRTTELATLVAQKKVLDDYMLTTSTELVRLGKLQNDLSVQLQDVDKQVTDLAKLSESYTTIQNDIRDWNTDLKTTEVNIEKINKRIQDIKNEKTPESKKPEYEAKISDLTALSEKLTKQIAIKQRELTALSWWSQKGFSSSGIKAFIFKAMLDQLNQNTKIYGQRLGVALEFSIDLTKASKPFSTVCSVGTKLNKDYKEFSGGQKQRLDIVLIFAMYDLISINTDINILAMDEVLEGLDEEGEAAVFDLIRTKADQGKSVYVISHSAVLDNLYANTINFGSDNNNTYIVN